MEPWPLPSDCVHFVNSVDSSEFSLFLRALNEAYIVAMDAEWKPLRSNNTKTFPRVSIMQLACRLASGSRDPLLRAHESTVLEDNIVGHSHSADSIKGNTGDGVLAILYESSSSPCLGSLGSNVVHTSHGVATAMVKSAIATGMLATLDPPTDAFSAAHTALVRKLGERLLLSEEMKKSFKKKPKRIQENREARLAEHGFFGPPPWDWSCGGDGTPKFLCDNMVEGLAKQLRNVGFDTVFLRSKKSDPRKLVELAEKEGRVLLTQDVNLLRRGFIPRNYAYRVKSNGKQDQLAEVVKVFNLKILEDNLLSRCSKCNGEFFPNALSPEEALATVSEGQTFPEYAIKERVLFWQCSQCLHMYWQGKQFYRALQNFQAFARKAQTSQ